jgi:glutamine phosphoribosylpyrophosphate amidotransferase
MSDVNLENIRGQVEILIYVKQKMRELKEVQDKATEAIQQVMKVGDIGYLDDEPVVQWGEHKANTFDQAAFAEDYPDLLEQYKSQKARTRFEVVK